MVIQRWKIFVSPFSWLIAFVNCSKMQKNWNQPLRFETRRVKNCAEKKINPKQLKHLPVKTYHHRKDCARMRSIPYFDTRHDDACVIIIHFLLFPYALLLHGKRVARQRKNRAHTHNGTKVWVEEQTRKREKKVSWVNGWFKNLLSK